MKLILASGSERRSNLLAWLGIPFAVVVSEFDENSIKDTKPAELVKKLALEKAKAVVKNLDSGLVIGADTVVAIDGQVIGKPADEDGAVRILKKLSGKTHAVFTGVAVVDSKSGSIVLDFEKTEVTFRKLSDKEIRDYVATGEPLDKGGAYAIQMGAKDFVAKVKGSYTNVVGLPLVKLARLLRKMGISIDNDVAKVVFEKTGYWS